MNSRDAGTADGRGFIRIDGGPRARALLLFDASADASRSTMLRLALEQVAERRGADDPDVVVALTPKAIDGIHSYFDEAQGAADDDEIPLARMTGRRVAIIAPGDDLGAEVVLSALPPMSVAGLGAQRLQDLAWLLSCEGVDARYDATDEADYLYTDVKYATGESGSEQVLGWDDLYSDAQWDYLTSEGPWLISVDTRQGDVQARMAALVRVLDIAATRGRSIDDRLLLLEVFDAQGIAHLGGKIGAALDLSTPMRRKLDPAPIQVVVSSDTPDVRMGERRASAGHHVTVTAFFEAAQTLFWESIEGGVGVSSSDEKI